MRTDELLVAVPEPFPFAGTVHAHGWAVLAPHRWRPGEPALERVHRLPSGDVVTLTLRPSTDAPSPSAGGAVEGSAVAVEVRHAGEALGFEREAAIRDAVRRMLRLDEDLSGFHERCRSRGGRWSRVPEEGLGRLLRSPTVFEDAVKTICTTNVQWGGTERMVRELVEACGDPLPGAVPVSTATRRAFPTADAIAATDPEAFAGRVGLGYRAPYVHELATRVASGALELEALADADLPTADLERELLAIRGVGAYAAGTLLMLLGRYDRLAVDSVFRSFVAERYFDGEVPSEEIARAVYEDWGRWRYLAYWFDLLHAGDEED